MIQAAQLLLSLSILIVLHEFGHFLPAKLFKIKVEKFYLFFDPWFSLIKIKKGETQYGIGWLPLGGYVKIAGMIDESMDKEQMAKPPEPWEFRAKPTWQRLIVMLGGVTVNMILAIIIYIGVLGNYGKEYLPTENAIYGVHCDSLLLAQGFAEGDLIAAVDGEKVESLNAVSKAMLLRGASQISVRREGDIVNINLPEGFDQLLVDNKVRTPFAPRLPFVIKSFNTGSLGEKAGLLAGDKIVSLNEDKTIYFYDFYKAIASHVNEEIAVGILRNGASKTINVQLDETAKIGANPTGPESFFELKHKKYDFMEAIQHGTAYGIETLQDYIVSMKFMFSKSGASQIGGFGAFANMFEEEWNWQVFWERTAFISIILAFMNVLPIPGLDGGHVMFLLYEMVARKPAPQKVMETAQMIGMILLFGLIIYANANDAIKAFFN